MFQSERYTLVSSNYMTRTNLLCDKLSNFADVTLWMEEECSQLWVSFRNVVQKKRKEGVIRSCQILKNHKV